MVVNEALACGLPVIISENVGARDYVQEGVNGLVVPAFNTDALIDAMTRIDTEEGLAQHLAAGAEATVSRTWSDYSGNLLTAWDGLMARRS